MVYKTEFHCHTSYSKDSLVTPEQLIQTCFRKKIDKIVVTDHNTIQGALEAQKINPDMVIVGEEIMTDKGELLGIYLKEEIPAGLASIDVIRLLREQKAFISVPHPFDFSRSGSWKKEDLMDILPHVDAIETFNARCLFPYMNRQAEELAKNFKLSATIGSDAHSLFELGRATLTLPEFYDAQSLKEVINYGVANTKFSTVFVRVTSRYAKFQKFLNR